jgi:hypothetical protein
MNHWLLIIGFNSKPSIIGPSNKPDVLFNAKEYHSCEPDACFYELSLNSNNELDVSSQLVLD